MFTSRLSRHFFFHFENGISPELMNNANGLLHLIFAPPVPMLANSGIRQGKVKKNRVFLTGQGQIRNTGIPGMSQKKSGMLQVS